MVLQNKNLWIGVLIIGLCLREVTPCWYDSTSPYESLWNINSGQCGTLGDNGKIVGGDTGLVINWPWVGYLEKNSVFTCTVELIAWNWATTSAACVDDGVTAPQLKVTFGRTDKLDVYTPGQVRNVNKIIIHPGYNKHGGYHHNNIALLRLDTPVTYDYFVRPICLPYSTYDGYYDNCYVAGWGYVGEDGEQPKPTNELQELKVELQTQTECQAQRNGLLPIREEHICADNVDSNGNPVFGGNCYGDAGAPLMCQIESSSSYPKRAWSLVGITSTILGGCGNANYFDVFTRASKFNQWISDSVDANGGP